MQEGLVKESTFQARLKESLEKKNFTISEFARLTGVNKSLICRYLGNANSNAFEPKTERLKKFAELLDVNDLWLLGYNVQKRRPVINNKYYHPTRVSEVDRVLGYGAIREIYEEIKDMEIEELNKLLSFIRTYLKK